MDLHEHTVMILCLDPKWNWEPFQIIRPVLKTVESNLAFDLLSVVFLGWAISGVCVHAKSLQWYSLFFRIYLF